MSLLFGLLRGFKDDPRPFVAIGLIMLFLVGFVIWTDHDEQRRFQTMTPAERLQKARSMSNATEVGRREIRRHLAAIPSEALSEQEEARLILEEVEKIENSPINDVKRVRAATIEQTALELRDRGYEVIVEQSDAAQNEVTIVSTDFGDTDRRVRFLSFLRRSEGPKLRLCWAGFSDVRLKTSRVPLFGFDTSYSLDCMK